MNKASANVFGAIMIVSLTILACGFQTIPTTQQPPATLGQINNPTETPTATNAPAHEFYAGYTQNTTYPYILIHRSGERLISVQENGSSTFTGVIWTSTGGESIVIHAGEDGKPESTVVGQEVILYSNYNNDTVDLTIVHADGSHESGQGKLKYRYSKQDHVL